MDNNVDADTSGQDGVGSSAEAETSERVNCGGHEISESGEQSRDEMYRVGIWRFHPDWLQVFRNAKFFTFLLCLFSVLEGSIVSGFLPVILSTLERRYSLTSVASGSIGVLFDVAVMVSSIFVSYFGERGHKPRWLGFSLILQGLACWLFMSPHLFFGRYTVGSATEMAEICSPESNVTDDCSSSNDFAYAIFITAFFLAGVAAAPLFTIGTSFIDDIAHPKFVPIYLGVYHTTIVLGPVIGFVLGGVFLSIYVDVGSETRLTQEDPGWVGAWWISYILTGGISFLIAIPFFMFPRELPNSDVIKAERVKEMAKVLKENLTERKTFRDEVKSFPAHMKALLLNPSYVCLCFALGTMFLLISGLADFSPKYLESQYRVDPSTSAFIIGAVGIVTALVGIIAGGVIIFVLKIRGKKLPFMMVVVQVIAIPLVFGFFASCPVIDIPGVTTSYADGSNTLENASCLSECNCLSSRYEPVCGTDGYTYISPCLAGCQVELTMEETMEIVYMDCICLNSTNLTATPGVCNSEVCSLLYSFIFTTGLQLLLLYTQLVPIVYTTVRVVAEEQRTLALGFQSLMWRLLGTIPGPLFFGALFDGSCVYWQFNCGERGNCWVYDNSSLANLAFTTGIVALTVALGFYTVTWLTYPKRQIESPQHPIKEVCPAADVQEQSEGGNSDDLGENAMDEKREKDDKGSNDAEPNNGDMAHATEMHAF